MTQLRCLSLWQPWASLMAYGAKKIETRGWTTSYRGPLAIHAAKRFALDEINLCHDEPFVSTLAAHGLMPPNRLPLGKIVAVVELLTCLQIHERKLFGDGSCVVEGVRLPPEGDERKFGNYAPGRYAWCTASCRRLPEPIPVLGRQGIFFLSEEVTSEVYAQIGSEATCSSTT